MSDSELRRRATDYQQRNPGTSYSMALLLVKQTIPRQFPGGMTEQQYSDVVDYMLSNPGVSGQDAIQIVKEGGHASRAGKVDMRSVLEEASQTPAGHDQVMAYMMANPGTTYADALTQAGPMYAPEKKLQEKVTTITTGAGGGSTTQPRSSVSSATLSVPSSREWGDFERFMTRAAEYAGSVGVSLEKLKAAIQSALPGFPDNVAAIGKPVDTTPFEKPACYDAAVAHMLAHPGMEYSAAVAHVTGR